VKHPKKPTVKQCKLMAKWHLNPADWFVVKDEPTQMTIVHRHSDTTVRIIKKEGVLE
jgi:hypothetical protein